MSHDARPDSRPGPHLSPQAASGGGGGFALSGPSPSSIPVLVSVPHAGRAYPPGLARAMRHPAEALPRLEDRLVDVLAEAVAREAGAMLIVARAPRALIDLNRAPDDIDWGMIAGGRSVGDGDGGGGDGGGHRARSGLGLVPRRLPGIGELWKGPLAHAELAARIARIHEPYHAAIAATLGAMRQRWGAALLLDLHSMPPLRGRAGAPGAKFVLGDRFGMTCDGRLVATAFAALARSGRPAAHNRPFAGGYVITRHAAPARGVHALQLEVDRLAYLDARQERPGEGFPGLVDLLAGLVRELAGQVRDLGGNPAPPGIAAGWAEAAE